MEKSMNKILNIILVIIAIVMAIMLIINFLSPLLYHENSKVSGGHYKYLNESYSVIEKYLGYMMKKEYSNANKCLPMVRQKDKTIYDNYSVYLNENYKELTINKIEKINYNNYLVTFTINTSRENKIVLHFEGEAKTAKVYYDKLLMQF